MKKHPNGQLGVAKASAFAKAPADKSADKSAGQVGARRRRDGRKMVNYPLNLRPAKNRDAPLVWLGLKIALKICRRWVMLSRFV
jgi:hypothetical protein